MSNHVTHLEQGIALNSIGTTSWGALWISADGFDGHKNKEGASSI